MDDRPTEPAPAVPPYEIPWLRLFPGLRLFRAPGAAADPKRLMLAALGLVLLSLGWSALDRVFPDSGTLASGLIPGSTPYAVGGWQELATRLTEPFWRLAGPFLTLFRVQGNPAAFCKAGLAALWAVAVWGLIGGAIARVAVIDLAKGERVGLSAALRFAARKAVPLLGSPLVPLLGVVAVGVPIAAFGLLYRVPQVGPAVAGVLAFLPLLGGLVLTLILVGLAAGWPLMTASVAAEGEDGFDALSRAYAYVHQRPWHYAGYAAVALLTGAVGLLFVDLFARAVVHLTAWGLAFSAPEGGIVTPRVDPGASPSDTASVAHGFWLGVVALLVHGWAYSYFWTVAATVYLLLRREVDGTPLGTIAYEGRPSLIVQAATDPAAVYRVDSPSVPPPHTAEARDSDEVVGH